MLRYGQSKSILGALLQNCMQQRITSVPKEQQSAFSATAHITSDVFSIISKARFATLYSQVTSPLIAILGITASLQTTYHMMMSLIKVL